MLAEQGLIAQIFCSAEGAAFIAPWGGTERRLATNPIAIAVPTAGEPILVDMTTSVVAEGKVKLACTDGKSVPPGWVLDKDGEPSTDPEDLYAEGTILPLGGPVAHKGYGLSVVVDLLGSVLNGALPGLMGPILHNHFLLQVFDPATIMDRSTMEAAQERYFEYLRSSRKRVGVSEILLPGEPEQRSAVDRRANGIPLDAGVIHSLSDLCERLSIAPLGDPPEHETSQSAPITV
jgi:LDH2 family malate/lactate/ureidoglycolate dehydrogenase